VDYSPKDVNGSAKEPELESQSVFLTKVLERTSHFKKESTNQEHLSKYFNKMHCNMKG
jgi:hypothetical protein